MNRVLIVEDDPMARKLLEIFIEESTKYNIVQSIESAAMVEFYCLNNKIDLILMDVCTGLGVNGLDVAEKLKTNYPNIKIVIITSQPECSYIDRARKSGVESFWYKSSNAEEIISVMDRTLVGESIYPDNTPTLRIGDANSVDFTSRELEVLRELISGKPDATIAEDLHMSLRTVKTHIQNMRDKTGFRNRTELAVRARESGLVIGDKREVI